MVKKKKIFKRITALAGAVLLLLVAVAPVISPSADALGVDFDVDNDEVVSVPSIYRLQIPLDVFTHVYDNITMENPLYSLCVADGQTLWEDVSFPTSGNRLLKFGAPYYDFNYSENVVLAGVYFDDGIERNGNEFSLSNSSSFVVSLQELFVFLARCRYDVPVFYRFSSSVSVTGLYPQLIHEGGWELAPFSFDFSYSYENSLSDTAHILAFGDVPDLDLPLDLSLDKLVIVEDISITFSMYAPLFATQSSKFEWANTQTFYMPYSADGFGHTFQEFYEKYPGRRVFVSDVPSSESFDLTVFLKNSVGSFMSTEIVPGLSFGGMLSVSIGISLVHCS